MRMKKIILLASIFVVSVLNAQNLIENGGFEKTRTHLGQTKFEGWTFHRNLVVEKVQGYKGNGAKVYMNNLVFRVYKRGKSNVIPVKGNSEYTLSFWCKGKSGEEEIEPTITWYDEKGKRLGTGKKLGKVSSTTQWTQKTFTFVAPLVAVTAGLSFRVSGSGESLIIDEVSLEKTGSGAIVPVPSGLEIKPFQREIEISWHKGLPNTKWEVFVNGTSKIVETNQYIATKLIPNAYYKIKIRTIIGTKKSEFTTEENVKTQNFERGKNDPIRVPSLRTLTIDGEPPQTIDLFFNDLYNADAEISCFLDGEVIKPKNNQLHFKKKGKQNLKMIIKEEEGFEWEIEYHLNVK